MSDDRYFDCTHCGWMNRVSFDDLLWGNGDETKHGCKSCKGDFLIKAHHVVKHLAIKADQEDGKDE